MNIEHPQRTYALDRLDDENRIDRFDSDAIVHALLYVGDAIERQNAILLAADRAERLPNESANGEARTDLPKLLRTLSAESPVGEPEPHGVDEESELEEGDLPEVVNLPDGYVLRAIKPATNPEDWRLDPSDGYFISPAGRRFNPRSKQALGVMGRLQRRGLALKIYDPQEPRPIRATKSD